jgi:hypothetical protein
MGSKFYCELCGLSSWLRRDRGIFDSGVWVRGPQESLTHVIFWRYQGKTQSSFFLSNKNLLDNNCLECERVGNTEKYVHNIVSQYGSSAKQRFLALPVRYHQSIPIVFY